MNKQNLLFNLVNTVLVVMFILFLLFKVNGPVPGIVCVVWVLFVWFGREWIVEKVIKP